MPRVRGSRVSERTRSTLALWGICLGFFAVLLDATIVNVALPAISSDLDQSLSIQQWTVNIYTLMFAAFTLNAGTWGDRWGARRVYLAGLALFSAGTTLCGVSPDTLTLLLGRALQGFGAAAVVPCSLALIMHRFPEGRARARALGAWGGISGIGLAAGPVLGGLLVDSVGWRGVFLVVLPVAAVSAALVLVTVDRTPRGARSRFDLLGQGFAVISLAALSWAITNHSARGAQSTWVWVIAAVGALAAIAFIVNEHRAREPMVPLGIFRVRNFSLAVSIGALFNFGLYGTLFCLALYVQNGLGLTARDAGFVILPMTAVIAICATLSGHLTGRFGPKMPMFIGLSAGLVSAGLLALSDSSTPLAVIVVCAAVFGGVGTAMPAMTSVALNAAPAERAGLGSGVLNSSRQTGGLLGVALLGSVLELQPGSPTLQPAMAIVASGYLVAVILTANIRIRDARPR